MCFIVVYVCVCTNAISLSDLSLWLLRSIPTNGHYHSCLKSNGVCFVIYKKKNFRVKIVSNAHFPFHSWDQHQEIKNISVLARFGSNSRFYYL
jgi:hypothetical protein